MSYIEETLSPNEQVLYMAKFHWFYTVTAVVLGIVLIPVLIGPVIFLYMMTVKWTTEIGITTNKVIYKRGWIARKTDEIGLSKLEEINFNQGILGRILGFGKVRLQGTGVGALELPSIDDPMKFRKEIGNAKAKFESSKSN